MKKFLAVLATAFSLLTFSLPVAYAQSCTPVTTYIEEAKKIEGSRTIRLEGQEAKAFEAVVKTHLSSTFYLEPDTVKIFFFELPGGLTVVDEVAENGCVLASSGAPTEVIQGLIARMSAEMDRPRG